MKKRYALCLITCIVMTLCLFGIHNLTKTEEKHIKVGFIFVGDEITPYTNNFIKARNHIKEVYGDRIECVTTYNVTEGQIEKPLQEPIDGGCDYIIAASYGYGQDVKAVAKKYPNIQFCVPTGDNANEKPVLSNYHNCFGEIYQGRYVCGKVAGMKIKQMIDENIITKEQAKVGYVAAFPLPEVISGYTSFYLGVRSVVPEAVMTVKYTNTWSSYSTEKQAAKELVDEDCVVISQHSDTAGPATACEETASDVPVFNVSYNQSMLDVAPTTYLTGCKINWKPYMKAAVDAVLNGKVVEKNIGGNIHGNDVGAGFDEGWVSMLEFNDIVVADGTKEMVADVIEQFKNDRLTVFKGDYIGVNTDNPNDIIDLSEGFVENKDSSAPSFNYILKDIITIE